jgi:hypothetical protein
VKLLRIVLGVIAILLVGLAGTFGYYDLFANPKIARELVEDPQGERAGKVMLITLPSGRRIPVNYLREGDRVYAGADGGWWQELVGDGVSVTLLVRGETLEGTARAVVDDPDHTKAVFARLRPSALPGFGTLVEVRLE